MSVFTYPQRDFPHYKNLAVIIVMIIPTEERYLTDWCRRPWAQVVGALNELVAGRSQFVAAGVPEAEPLLAYAAAVARVANELNESDPLAPIDRAVIHWLDADAARELCRDPKAKEVRAVVSYELFTLHAGLGLLEQAAPYTPEEIFNFSLGLNPETFNPATLVFTLWQALAAPELGAYAPACIVWLTKGNEAPPSAPEMSDWHGGLVVMMTLQIAWHAFTVLPADSQELLLKRWLYAAIATGVPVRAILERAYRVAPAPAQLPVGRWANALLANQEFVPTQTNNSAWRRLGEVFKLFSAAGGFAAGSGFVLEQFVNTMYQSQIDREVYAGWLRDALIVMAHLAQGKIK